MGPKAVKAAAPAPKNASTEETTTNAEAEPSNDVLAGIIGVGSKPAKTAKGAKPAAKPAKPAKPDPDNDPDFDDDADDAAGDPTADEAEDDTDATSAAADDESTEGAADDDDAGDSAPNEDEDPLAAPADETESEAGGEDDDTEPEGLDDADRATRKGFTPEQQAKFDKAIQKRARKEKELKTQLAEAQQAIEELTKAPAAAIAPTADNPLADVEDEPALETRLQEARLQRRWALKHPEGGTVVDDKGKEHEITKERVADVLLETEELLNYHAPRRAQYLRDRVAKDAEAVQQYPWLKNKLSQGAVRVETLFRKYPALRSIPEAKLLLADAVAGRHARESAAKRQTAGTRSAEVPKAPATHAGAARPPKVAAAAKQHSGATKTFEATGEDPGNAVLRGLITIPR